MREKIRDILLRLAHTISIIIVIVLLFSIAAFNKNGKIFGYEPLNFAKENSLPKEFTLAFADLATIKEIDNLTYCYNSRGEQLGIIAQTTKLSPQIQGFGDKIPLYIVLNNQRQIKSIILGKHSEDDIYFQRVLNSKLLTKWDNLPLEEAKSLKLDAVSGATVSSRAILDSMEISLQQLTNPELKIENYNSESVFLKNLDLPKILALLTILSAVIAYTLLKKNIRYRKFQLLLNVVFLGVITGSFVSLNSIIATISSGVVLGANYISGIMLLVALILPIFTGRRFYCFYLCPLGSFQELLGTVRKKKPKLPPTLLKVLSFFPFAILIFLLVSWGIGIGFVWSGYELFGAMLYTSFNSIFIVALIIIALISLFVNRPYCRFICPTGFLIKNIEKKDSL